MATRWTRWRRRCAAGALGRKSGLKTPIRCVLYTAPQKLLPGSRTEAGREEKGLQFDLEKEAWRFTFERAKPNAMRLRIEVYPKSSATASQVLFAFPDPKGSN